MVVLGGNSKVKYHHHEYLNINNVAISFIVTIQLSARVVTLLDSVLEHSSGNPLHLILITDRQQILILVTYRQKKPHASHLMSSI